MTDLKPEERDALIRALKNCGVIFTGKTSPPGPGFLWEYGGQCDWFLTPAGTLLAQSLKRERGANRDAMRYRFLRDLKANSFSLSFNEQSAPNYQTVAEHIDEHERNTWYSDVSDEELERMKETNSDWQLQIYPNSPVGFNVHIGATLDAVIDEALPPPPEPER